MDTSGKAGVLREAPGRSVQSRTEPSPDHAWGEEALVAGLRRGDEAAYAVLIRTYGGRLLLVARHLLRHDEDARDCLQEAFLLAFRRIDGFEGKAALGTWLHRIVANQALSRLRSKRSRPEESIDELLPILDEDGIRIEPTWRHEEPIEDLLGRRTIRDVVRAKIDQLPDAYRNVLLLKDIEELETSEVAALLELNEGAVRVRLHRARAALKKLLEPVWRGEIG